MASKRQRQHEAPPLCSQPTAKQGTVGPSRESAVGRARQSRRHVPNPARLFSVSLGDDRLRAVLEGGRVGPGGRFVDAAARLVDGDPSDSVETGDGARDGDSPGCRVGSDRHDGGRPGLPAAEVAARTRTTSSAIITSIVAQRLCGSMPMTTRPRSVLIGPPTIDPSPALETGGQRHFECDRPLLSFSLRALATPGPRRPNAEPHDQRGQPK